MVLRFSIILWMLLASVSFSQINNNPFNTPISAKACTDAGCTGSVLKFSTYRLEFTTPTPIPNSTPTSMPTPTNFNLAISQIGTLESGGLGLVGEQITWVIDVTNIGDMRGVNLEIVNRIPRGLRIEDATTQRGTVTINGQLIAVHLPSLEVNETVQVRIETTILDVPASGLFENNVTLTAQNEAGKSLTRTAKATVLGTNELPQTGYPPTTRPAISIGNRSWRVALLFLTGLGLGLALVYRKRKA